VSDYEVWRVPSAPNPFTHNKVVGRPHACRSHPPSPKLRRASRLELQVAAFQKDRAGVFHFVQRASNVARLKLDSAASV
jgi:hypothetical protein